MEWCVGRVLEEDESGRDLDSALMSSRTEPRPEMYVSQSSMAALDVVQATQGEEVVFSFQ